MTHNDGRRLRGAILLVAGSMLLVAGCTVRAGGLPVGAGSDARVPTMVLATGVEGCDCTHAVLLPPAGPSLGRALEEALAQVDEAVVLTDATVETSTIWTGVYNRRCACVRGSAAKVARQIVLPAPAGHHGHGGHGGHH